MTSYYLSQSPWTGGWSIIERIPDPAGRADYDTVIQLNNDEAWFVYMSCMVWLGECNRIPEKGYAKLWHIVSEKNGFITFQFQDGPITFPDNDLTKSFLEHFKNKTEFESIPDEDYALRKLSE